MKRFLVFGGEIYYAKGGFHDFLSSHDTLEAAVQCAQQYDDTDVEWWHIFDATTGTIVAHSDGEAYGTDDEAPHLIEIRPV
jgi:hypothetical protein